MRILRQLELLTDVEMLELGNNEEVTDSRTRIS